MELLIETIQDSKNEILTEGANGSKRYIIEGLTIQTDVKNKNRRIYPKNNIRKEVERYINEMVLTNKSVGELNHPDPDKPNRIDYKNVSHKFEKLTETDQGWVGRAVVTQKTPSGQVVAGLMDEGVIMGISSRATGSTLLNENGCRIVQKDYSLVTPGDIVSDPSAPDAFLQNLMEGADWIWDNGALLYTKEHSIRESVNKQVRNKRLNEESAQKLMSAIIKMIGER